jgi:hypothetical protein
VELHLNEERQEMAEIIEVNNKLAKRIAVFDELVADIIPVTGPLEPLTWKSDHARALNNLQRILKKIPTSKG